MTLGKSLRMRRIFANGRALVVPLDHRTDDPVPLVRSVARSGVDAVALSFVRSAAAVLPVGDYPPAGAGTARR